MQAISSTNTKHPPHSPKTPTPTTTTTTTTSSAAMLERALSSRRAAPYVDESLSADESKTRRQNLHLLVSNYLSRLTHHRVYTSPFPLLCLVFVVVLIVYCYRSFVWFSQPVPRVGFEGFGSDFGSLGVPWCRSKHGETVEWTPKDLLKGLEEFVPIYETRPIKNNMNGMGFDHSFGLWFIARRLKPNLMIESGAFKGHSTWVLRQAMPDTPIISISPRHPGKYLLKGPAYVDGNCTYFSGKDFVDFGSVDWNSVMRNHRITDPAQVLVFFDDHQNELKRVMQALNAGFQHLVFEDNYDTGTGDHYSLRQICDQKYIRGGGHSCYRESDEARFRSKRKNFWEKAVDVDELCGPQEAWWGVRGWMRDDFNHTNKQISYEEHFKNSRFIESVLDVYWELPPVAGPSLTHQTRYDPARATTPIVEDGRHRMFKRIGLGRLDSSVFNGYTQMVYLRISRQ